MSVLEKEKEELELQNKILQNRIQDLERNSVVTATTKKNLSVQAEEKSQDGEAELNEKLKQALDMINLLTKKNQFEKNATENLLKKVEQLRKEVEREKINYKRICDMKNAEIETLNEKLVLLAQHNIEL